MPQHRIKPRSTRLTPYERRQVREIAGWKAEHPALFVEAMEVITHPLVKVIERFLPVQTIRDTIEMAYRDSEILAHREDVATFAKVADVKELRRVDLARCDKLADHFARKAAFKAAARESTMIAGPMLTMELSVRYALKAVHMIGFCYGFTPEDPRAKVLALTTLLAASAGSMEEKSAAIAKLRPLEDMMLEDMVEDALEMAAEKMAETLVETSTPAIGMVIQCLEKAAVTVHVGEVAKRVFQEHWLQANGKVDRIPADPRWARSRLQRTKSLVRATVYWPSYWMGYAVTYPTTLLTSFLPKSNPAVRGAVDGGHAASRDVQHLRRRVRDAVAEVTAPAPEPVLVPVAVA